jgi:hypothetical protein
VASHAEFLVVDVTVQGLLQSKGELCHVRISRGHSTYDMIGWDEPAIYVGSFREDHLNGYGLLAVRS